MANRQYLYPKTTAPTVNDDTGDGYKVGDVWLDTTNDKIYKAIDVTASAAVWRDITLVPTANGLSLIQAANYAAMKALLDLEIGTDVQAYNAVLTTLAGASANGQSLVTAADYAAMKVLLGLVIGTNVQAYDADLTTWAGLTPSAFFQTLVDDLTAGATLTTLGLTANGQSLVTAANYAAMRTLLDLEPGVDYQAYDAELAALAGLVSAADGLPYFTGSGTAALATLTTFARTLLDDTTAGGLMTTLGITANGQSLITAANYAAMKVLLDIAVASTTTSGQVELAIASEVNTGTDATRAVTPDSLAGSNLGIRYAQVLCFNFTTNTATGDGKGYIVIPAALTGMNLVSVHARVITAGTTGTMDIQIANVTDTQDMLSTKITIDTGETGSDTAATAAVINTTYDDVATNDLLRIDVDAVHTTPAKGLIVTLGFQLP